MLAISLGLLWKMKIADVTDFLIYTLQKSKYELIFFKVLCTGNLHNALPTLNK